MAELESLTTDQAIAMLGPDRVQHTLEVYGKEETLMIATINRDQLISVINSIDTEVSKSPKKFYDMNYRLCVQVKGERPLYVYAE